MGTTELCVRIFNAKGASSTVRGIDIAHRETPPVGALNVSSASLFDAFLRSLTYSEGVKLSRYNLKIKE